MIVTAAPRSSERLWGLDKLVGKNGDALLAASTGTGTRSTRWQPASMAGGEASYTLRPVDFA
jgi:hypothetical protein